jgi:MFS family permease
MMFVKMPMQFYVMRFLLGAAEAGFFPGVVFYLMQWFPAEHRGRAISRFYVALPLSSVVMGAVAGALLNLHGQFGLAGWQWLFLVEGIPAVLLSAVVVDLRLHVVGSRRAPGGYAVERNKRRLRGGPYPVCLARSPWCSTGGTRTEAASGTSIPRYRWR